MGELSKIEMDRLKESLAVCYAIPFIDDVEDFIFEAIFYYTLRRAPVKVTVFNLSGTKAATVKTLMRRP